MEHPRDARGSANVNERSPSRVPVSVLCTARDEEEQLPQALATVAGWADEMVVVVDPRSRDHTRGIAASAGALVFEHDFVSSAAQCNWGLARCRQDWVLVLDADERVNARLRAAIERAVASPTAAAYAVRRRNLAFDRCLRFGDWGADSVVRLLDRRQARFAERAVHGIVQAPSVGRLEGAIEHYTLRSLEQYAPKLRDYAHRGAADLIAAGRRSSAAAVLVRPVWRFLRAYLFRLGLLDGGPGLVVALLAAHSTFLKWALVWEHTTIRRPRP
jgi:glycosyltransferase involved in cell wall biosynthesis